jgi:hypothetical protein
MKNLFLLVSITTLLFSCKKDEDTNQANYWRLKGYTNYMYETETKLDEAGDSTRTVTKLDITGKDYRGGVYIDSNGIRKSNFIYYYDKTLSYSVYKNGVGGQEYYTYGYNQESTRATGYISLNKSANWYTLGAETEAGFGEVVAPSKVGIFTMEGDFLLLRTSWTKSETSDNRVYTQYNYETFRFIR